MRTLEIFLRYRFLRIKNGFLSNTLFGRKKSEKRTGTPSRFSPNLVFGVIILLWIAASVYGFQYRQIKTFLTGASDLSSDGNYALSYVHLKLLSTYLGLSFLGGLFFSLGSRQFSQTESDLEFLVTLPISKRFLMWVRVVERAIVNPTFYFLLYPCFLILFQMNGHSFLSSLVLGLLLALPLFFISGAIQALIDTGLRLRLKPSRIKMLQGVLSMLGVLFFYFLNMTRGGGIFYLQALSDKVSSFILFTPPGLLILSFYSKTFPYAETVYFFIEFLILVGVCYFILLSLVRDGVALNSGQSGVRKKRGEKIKAPSSFSFLSPLTWKEFLLLKRDPSYLFQTLLIPILVFGIQLALFSQSKVHLLTSIPAILSIGFGMAAYSMLFSCFMGLQSEGKALWIWYTLPQSIESMVWKKSGKWVILSSLFFFAFLAMALVTTHLSVTWSDVPILAAAVIGVPLFGWLATSFGILGFDVLATNPRKVKQGAIYAYLLFAGTYVVLFHLNNVWQTLVGLGLTLLVVQSFWQKARDRVPYLLDPTALPPSEISLGDGLIAAQVFFILQLLMNALYSNGSAFKITFFPGVTTLILVLIYFKWMKVRNVPRLFPKEKKPLLLYALGGAVAGLTISWAYCKLATFIPALSEKMNESLNPLWNQDGVGLMVYAVLGAPIFEELIFRGLIYRGLKRSYPKAVALILNGLLFAIFHPGVAFPSVFSLGVILAVIFEETDSLFAPMMAHAIYNAGVLLVLPQLC